MPAATEQDDSVVGVWTLSEMTMNGTTYSVDDLAKVVGSDRANEVSIILNVRDDGSFELQGAQGDIVASGFYERVEAELADEEGAEGEDDAEQPQGGWTFSVSGSDRHVGVTVEDGRLSLHDASTVESMMTFERG